MAGKEAQNQESQKIIAALETAADALSLEQIGTALNDPINESTLRRRLKKLADQGIVQITGKGRATKYRRTSHVASGVAEINRPDPVESQVVVPLSTEGAAVRDMVSRPAGNRPPTAYDQYFLRNYQPNKTFYLSESERTQLYELGKTAQLTEPAGTYARNILQRLLIDLSWNSSRLEGNQYSLLDTKRLISQGKAADQRSAEDAQMILNHKEAIEFIVEAAAEIDFNRYTITNLHAQLSYNLLGDPAASGRLRSIPVEIGHSVYIPLAIPQLISEMFNVLLEKAAQIEDPFEQSFFVMVQLPYLQPFDDVNKRVSRLAANIPLIKHNLAPLSFVDVPKELYAQGLLGIYELKRMELFRDVFLWAYERSAQRYAALRQSMGEPDAFRLRYREELRALIQQVITRNLSLQDANTLIAQESTNLPIVDRERFIEATETELLSLHEGNFARYRVTPTEFNAWKMQWDQP